MKLRTAARGSDEFREGEDALPQHGHLSARGSFDSIEWTPELHSELLDHSSWEAILELYARTMKLAVALIDADGRLVGKCHNPQPIWSATRDKNAGSGVCLFCLETSPNCTAASEALRMDSLTLVHDQAGFAHVALPLTLGGRHLGTLLAGQVLDRYPEPLPLQRAAREFGVSAQQVWHLAVQEAPISRANLTVYGELLWALGQTFLRDRYGRIREKKSAAATAALNQELAAANSALNRKVAELDQSNRDLLRAEHLAENARVYAENIVATVRSPLLVLDDTFHVLSANEAFYNTFHVTATETEGQFLYELGNGQWNIPELRRLFDELLPRDQSVHNFEMVHDFAKIGRRNMILNARRIDHVDLILLGIEDITQRKAAETSLRKVNLDLKHFAYAASHDLQEPLRNVKLYTQLLARNYSGKLDAQADEFIANTIEGTDRVETLLRDLREYWLANEPLANCRPVDCEGVLQKTIQTLQVPIAESAASVTNDPLPTVSGEEVGLTMLFQNLLSNAVKYRCPGTAPSIHISSAKKGTAWCFSVKDNGIGIETEYLDQIFAPFMRLHGTDYPGSGIGLALCRKIVERYGGELWVESYPGKGSTFSFTIPG